MSLFGFSATAIGVAATNFVKEQKQKKEDAKLRLLQAEEECCNEAQTYIPQHEETVFQNNMKKLLLKYCFSTEEKERTQPLDDWKFLPKKIHVCGSRSFSFLTDNRYSFCTEDAIYYHNKHKGIHQFMFFDGINDVDTDTWTVDYGKDHQKCNITDWDKRDKAVIQQISNIWKLKDETDTSIFEYCFNKDYDLDWDLAQFRSNEVRSIFVGQCKHQNAPELLSKKFDHIRIIKASCGEIHLQFWAYIPKPQTVTINEDDDYDVVQEKELRQEKYNYEVEHMAWEAEYAAEELPKIKDDIVLLFQQSLYKLYGVLYDKEKICYEEDADITYEGPSIIDKAENVIGAFENYARVYVERNMREIERNKK